MACLVPEAAVSDRLAGPVQSGWRDPWQASAAPPHAPPPPGLGAWVPCGCFSLLPLPLPPPSLLAQEAFLPFM